PGAQAASLDVFGRARSLTTRPLVGIGGINAENAPQVLQAGANWLAVVAAVFAATNIEAATRQLCQCMAQRL
ncbi:MAG: thiamine phosphate synthase, partial [Nevskiales bacterium]